MRLRRPVLPVLKKFRTYLYYSPNKALKHLGKKSYYCTTLKIRRVCDQEGDRELLMYETCIVQSTRFSPPSLLLQCASVGELPRSLPFGRARAHGSRH